MDLGSLVTNTWSIEYNINPTKEKYQNVEKRFSVIYLVIEFFVLSNS
jgi:hypothetical protein